MLQKYRGAVHGIWNLKYSIPKEIPTVFHSGSAYDYHFIIKDLAEESEKQFTCLGQNTEKHIPFSVPVEKEVTIIKKMDNEFKETILQITIYW